MSKQLSNEAVIDEMLREPCLKYKFYDEAVSSEKPIDLNEFFEKLIRSGK